MHVRTIDDYLHLASLSATRPQPELRSALPIYEVDDSLGALRGFLFALGIQCAVGLLGLGGWELWRLLR